jgi:xanthine/CO dehydrogenase XdhC/CoxF family maturation factor
VSLDASGVETLSFEPSRLGQSSWLPALSTDKEDHLEDVLSAIRQLGERKERGVLVSVVRTSGAAMAEAGAIMLILPSGETAGTVGEDGVEEEVRRVAREVMSTGEATLLTLSLPTRGSAGPAQAHGSMDVFIEPVG